MGNICNSFTTSSRKIITLIFFAIMLAIIGICYFTLLDEVAFSKKDWDKDVYKSLNALIVDHAGKNDYAVFDFDKTTIVHDVSNALLVYQVENLKFADAPSHSFLDGIDDKDAILKGAEISSREMGDTLKAEYNRMKARLSDGESMDSIRVSDDYLDFRARFISFMDALGKTFSEEVWYAWMPGLLTGMTTEEAKELISEAIDDQLGEDKLAVEEWTSPDGRWGGPVEKGIFLPEEFPAEGRTCNRRVPADHQRAVIRSASVPDLRLNVIQLHPIFSSCMCYEKASLFIPVIKDKVPGKPLQIAVVHRPLKAEDLPLRFRSSVPQPDPAAINEKGEMFSVRGIPRRVFEKTLPFPRTVRDVQKHLLMIPHQKDGPVSRLFLKTDQMIQRFPDMRAAVNVIAHKDDPVFLRSVGDLLEQRIQGALTAVNIPDQYGSVCHCILLSRPPLLCIYGLQPK